MKPTEKMSKCERARQIFTDGKHVTLLPITGGKANSTKIDLKDRIFRHP